MARRRRFSEEPFGSTIERLMSETGTTYRALAAALGVEPEHFREYRLRRITERLEEMPELVDRLYRRLAQSS